MILSVFLSYHAAQASRQLEYFKLTYKNKALEIG